MIIHVNGQQREVSQGSSIADLLEHLQLDRRYVAVERNLELVPRGEHATAQLADGDRLEVVTLVGGG
ncbi:MAG: sulfur carrier protein ThiS [Planctomycetota bacterium]